MSLNEVIGVRLVAVFKMSSAIGGPCLDPALAPNELAKYMGVDERGQPWLLVFQVGPESTEWRESPFRWLKWKAGHLPFVEPA